MFGVFSNSSVLPVATARGVQMNKSAGEASFNLARKSVRLDVQTAKTPSGLAVATGLVLFATAWLLLLTTVSLSPPVDNIEQLTWVRSLQWGYYKHPPLPTWLLWLTVQGFGLTERAAYLLGAAVTMSAMGMLWWLLRELRGARHATLALLCTLCVTFYNGRLDYYNHNVVLLLAVVVSAWCCWRAYISQQLRWWAALGLALGMGGLSKYQIAVTVVSVLCFWGSQKAWREQAHVRGLLLATVVGCLVFSPHLVWLSTHDFGPIHYAMASSIGTHLSAGARVFNAANWLADELVNRCLIAFVLLGVCAFVAQRTEAYPSTPGTSAGFEKENAARALILCWAVVPLVFMPAMAVVFGSDLQLQWGTAFLPFVIPAAMELKPRAFWRRVRLGLALKLFTALQVLLLLVNFLTSPAGMSQLKDTHWRTFDSKALASQLAEPARAALGGPVKVVIGDAALAGVLALRLPERPVVLINGSFDISPWVPSERVKQCGALEIIRAKEPPIDSQAVGVAFPGLFWRAIQPLATSAACS